MEYTFVFDNPNEMQKNMNAFLFWIIGFVITWSLTIPFLIKSLIRKESIKIELCLLGIGLIPLLNFATSLFCFSVIAFGIKDTLDKRTKYQQLMKLKSELINRI